MKIVKMYISFLLEMQAHIEVPSSEILALTPRIRQQTDMQPQISLYVTQKGCPQAKQETELNEYRT